MVAGLAAAEACSLALWGTTARWVARAAALPSTNLTAGALDQKSVDFTGGLRGGFMFTPPR